MDPFNFRLNRKRKRSTDPEDDADKKKLRRLLPPKEILVVIDEDDDTWDVRRGDGSPANPITFARWSTGDVITISDSSEVIAISDSEDDVSDRQRNRKLPLKRRRDSSSLTNGFGRRLFQDASQVPNYDEEEDDSDNESFIIVKEDHVEHRPARQPWIYNVKKETPEPALTFSQDIQATEDVSTPSPPQRSSSTAIPLSTKRALQYVDDDALFSRDPSPPKYSWFGYPGVTSNQEDTSLPRGAGTISESTKLLRQKKRLFYYEYWEDSIPSIERSLKRFHNDVQTERQADICWLCRRPNMHPGTRAFNIEVKFTHDSQRHKIYIPLGFAAMMVEKLMTDKHREGIINEGWHCSHLCGNWTCLNPRHVVPEPGSININRNSCFPKFDEDCTHSPKCLKQLKVPVHSLREFRSFSDVRETNQVQKDSSSTDAPTGRQGSLWRAFRPWERAYASEACEEHHDLFKLGSM
ncbi:hypothetical protein BCR34DRAFT_3195 [Clohesyomyces aquaticus]|uniref:Zinc-binding loop region of homing endonuclease domain-containing protein n=1 Tax=Clohesyomyces aquaticus TaxID=1231657 RepID=A0A1Y2AB67_9PLEO|nr:hypothetical protein BCR34DRAFT_3195 [Clohesyomyces aquaticus]